MATRDPVEVYKEGVNVIEKGIGTLAQLKALNDTLYGQMTLDLKIGDLAKVDPQMKLSDAISGVYKTIKGTYDQIESLIEKTEDPNLKAYMRSYLDKTKPLIKAYLIPLISVLQTSTKLKMVPLQKELETYQNQITELGKEVRKLE